MYGETEVWFHEFLTVVVDGCESLASLIRLRQFYPQEMAVRCPLDLRAGLDTGEKMLLSLSAIEFRFLGFSARSLPTIATETYRFMAYRRERED